MEVAGWLRGGLRNFAPTLSAELACPYSTCTINATVYYSIVEERVGGGAPGGSPLKVLVDDHAVWGLASFSAVVLSVLE